MRWHRHGLLEQPRRHSQRADRDSDWVDRRGRGKWCERHHPAAHERADLSARGPLKDRSVPEPRRDGRRIRSRRGVRHLHPFSRHGRRDIGRPARDVRQPGRSEHLANGAKRAQPGAADRRMPGGRPTPARRCAVRLHSWHGDSARGPYRDAGSVERIHGRWRPDGRAGDDRRQQGVARPLRGCSRHDRSSQCPMQRLPPAC